MGVEAAVGHELVDEEQIAVSMAPADELHEVLVPEPAYDPHLRGVLLPPLLGALGNPLDGHVEVQLLEKSSVHGAEASFSELVAMGEVVGGDDQPTRSL
jgi:hypothetical protein